MEKPFDPYYKWLGIPPRDQPPNHYRLLGIEMFEVDRDVIDAAANRVMSYLKDLAVADEAQHSQKLLNEVSRARLCLLNRQKKAAYDEELRSQLAGRASAPGDGMADATAAAGRSPIDALSEPLAPPASPPVPSPGPPQLKIKIAESPPRSVRHGTKQRNDLASGRTGRPVRRLTVLMAVLFVLATVALLLLIAKLREPNGVVRHPNRPGTVGPTAPDVARQWQWPPPDFDVNADQDADDPRNSGGPSSAEELAPLEVPPWAEPPLEPPEEIGSEPSPKLPSPLPEVPTDQSPDGPPAGVSIPSDEPAGPIEPDATPPDPAPDPRTSTLPQRDDLVNPNTIGTIDPQEEATSRPPKPPPPAAGTETPPADAADLRDPFADLPSFITLPSIDPTERSASKTLGPVHLQDQDSCSIELRGGDRVARRPHRFTMRRTASSDDLPDWEFLLHHGETQTRIARLTIDAASLLTFHWEEDAAAAESAPLLANCALLLTGPHDTLHVMALREPVQREAVQIDLTKPVTREELNIKHAPDAKSVIVQVLGLDGAEAKLDPPLSASADDGQLTLELVDAGSPLVLDIRLQTRRTLQLNITPRIQLDPADKPDPRDQRPIPAKLDEQLKIVRTYIHQWESQMAALPRSALTSSQRNLMEKDLQDKMSRAQALLVRLQELQAWLVDPDSKLGLRLRVYFDADETPVGLLHVGDANPPDDDQAP